MRDSSTPVLILGSNENSLSVTGHLRRLGITVRDRWPPDCLDWPKIADTASHVFPLLRISDPMPTVDTAFAVPHHVTVK
jgi:hypothetical protein